MRTLQPRADKYRICIGDTSIATEFEIQAQLYADLLAIGLDVRGEVTWRYPDSKGQCRFDLVIFKDDVAVEIIEVKNGRGERDYENTRQGRRYTEFGVPVTFVCGHVDADMYVMSKRQAAA